MNTGTLAEAENRLRHGVEGGRASAALLAEVRQSRRIVGEQRHCLAPEKMEKTPNGKEDSQKLTVVDGKE